MIIRRNHRPMPGLNTTSTADISFMLLIFFLVTTNMDVDKGLRRQLPPIADNHQEAVASQATTLTLSLDSAGRAAVDGKSTPLGQVGGRVAAFIRRTGKRHLIKLDVDPATPYNAYFQVQDQLTAVYRQWRDQTSQRLYHRAFDRLSAEERERVADMCPQRVAESY